MFEGFLIGFVVGFLVAYVLLFLLCDRMWHTQFLSRRKRDDNDKPSDSSESWKPDNWRPLWDENNDNDDDDLEEI